MDEGLVRQQGPEVHLAKILTLRRGDAAARALIGPLKKQTDAEPKQVHDCVEATAWSLRCVDVEP